jgi:hypothetical protein
MLEPGHGDLSRSGVEIPRDDNGLRSKSGLRNTGLYVRDAPQESRRIRDTLRCCVETRM